jgi:hypothetical protein
MPELHESSGYPTSVLPSGNFQPDPSAHFTPVLKGRQTQPTLQSTGTTERQVFTRVEQSRTLKELQEDPLYGRLWQSPQQPEPTRTELEAASEHRLAILARKYEGAVLTREDVARVAILTQRLRRLAPRVTHLSWTIAEDSVQELEATAARASEIGAKYGL